ncbi:MAG TPA: hypothetical protein VNA28_05540 [Solirubrobacteraceae bacterium]|nr:hypothetical protein [Solirubrobacteraceae bacterium]
MKFGKRRQEFQVPGVPGVTIPVSKPKGSGRRRGGGISDAPPASAPVTDSWTGTPAETAPPTAALPTEQPAEPTAAPLGYAEPVVEGEAVELPPVEPAAPIYEPPLPLTQQGTVATPRVADQPISAVEAGGPVAGGAGVSSLSDSGAAFASGHAAAPGPSWQEPLMALADERPELVVGAAFAGGILAAMILRRLGN